MQGVARGCAYSVGIVLVGILVIIASQCGYEAYQRANNIWWQSDADIAAHLLKQTPVGSTEVAVVAWLKSQGVADPYVSRFVRTVEPEEWFESYHFNVKTRSTAIIQTVVARHGFPFETTVGVFYFFYNERLMEIWVRKSTTAF